MERTSSISGFLVRIRFAGIGASFCALGSLLPAAIAATGRAGCRNPLPAGSAGPGPQICQIAASAAWGAMAGALLVLGLAEGIRRLAPEPYRSQSRWYWQSVAFGLLGGLIASAAPATAYPLPLALAGFCLGLSAGWGVPTINIGHAVIVGNLAGAFAAVPYMAGMPAGIASVLSAAIIGGAIGFLVRWGAEDSGGSRRRVTVIRGSRSATGKVIATGARRPRGTGRVGSARNSASTENRSSWKR